MAAIVVRYVDKPEGRAALAAAAAEARRRSAGLLVVVGQRVAEVTGPDHQSPGQKPPVESFTPTVPPELTAEMERLGVAYEVRPASPGVEPAEELIAAADEAGAELIVIGLRRRSPVGKLLLGGNAQRVLLDASCPVLTVKAELDR